VSRGCSGTSDRNTEPNPKLDWTPSLNKPSLSDRGPLRPWNWNHQYNKPRVSRSTATIPWVTLKRNSLRFLPLFFFSFFFFLWGGWGGGPNDLRLIPQRLHNQRSNQRGNQRWVMTLAQKDCKYFDARLFQRVQRN
jgi:hypothetical protein